uniref:Uncharacterized protein n=1 Tax=Arundo donax TaxID=35708 RepID=A0A0A9SW67_ARUDO
MYLLGGNQDVSTSFGFMNIINHNTDSISKCKTYKRRKMSANCADSLKGFTLACQAYGCH